jgi:anthranilate phosphoribosyltransferase
MDEISFTGDTFVAELKDGEVREYVLNPRELGLPLHDVQSIRITDALQSAHMVDSVLAGERIPARDIVLLNAGAAIYIAGKAADLAQGIALATDAIDNGGARRKLQQLAAFTQQQ